MTSLKCTYHFGVLSDIHEKHCREPGLDPGDNYVSAAPYLYSSWSISSYDESNIILHAIFSRGPSIDLSFRAPFLTWSRVFNPVTPRKGIDNITTNGTHWTRDGHSISIYLKGKQFMLCDV